MVGHPAAGYPNKKAAVMAFLAQRLDDAEILRRVGTTRGALDVYKGLFRRAQLAPIGEEDFELRRAKAERIYRASLALIAEATGIKPLALHTLFRTIRLDTITSEPDPTLGQKIGGEGSTGDALPVDADHIADASKMVAPVPAASPPPGDAAEPAEVETPDPSSAGNPIPEPEPEPMMTMRPLSVVARDERVQSGTVTLRNASGEYLNLDGSDTTTNRQHAYRGTIAQAKAMRGRNPLAKGFTISNFIVK